MPGPIRGLWLAAVSVLCAGAVSAQAPRREDLLVTPQWLSQHLNDRDLVVLQVGGGQQPGYDKHIPGARYADVDAFAARGTPDALSLEMPRPDSLRALLQRFGISDRSRIVVAFTGQSVASAARVLYSLAYAGLGDRTAYLDGGVPAWQRAGYPLVTGIPTVQPGRITRRPDTALVVDYSVVTAVRAAPHAKVVDARSAAFFNGPAQNGNLPGHVPGSVSIPYLSVFDDSLRVLPTPALAERFRAAGIAPGDTVVAYCHIGAQATALLFAARLAGHPTRLYDGSFQDWSRRKLAVEGGTP